MPSVVCIFITLRTVWTVFTTKGSVHFKTFPRNNVCRAAVVSCLRQRWLAAQPGPATGQQTQPRRGLSLLAQIFAHRGSQNKTVGPNLPSNVSTNPLHHRTCFRGDWQASVFLGQNCYNSLGKPLVSHWAVWWAFITEAQEWLRGGYTGISPGVWESWLVEIKNPRVIGKQFQFSGYWKTAALLSSEKLGSERRDE